MNNQRDKDDPNLHKGVANGSTSGFAVTDELSANWLVRRIKESRSYGEHVLKWAARELRRAKREETFLMSQYGPQLETWVRSTLLAQGRKRRSVALPAGHVDFRASHQKTLITDTQSLIRWCKTNLSDAYTLRVFARGSDAVRLAESLIE
jgi:hypothetical protein